MSVSSDQKRSISPNEGSESRHLASNFSKLFRVALPWGSIFILAIATATVAGVTFTPRTTSTSTRAALTRYPILTTFVTTVIGSILAGATAWAYSRSVTYWVCKTKVKNGMKIDHLQSWNALATGSLRVQIGRWYLITSIFVVILGLLTSVYTTLITPRPLSLNANASGAKELDITSPAFETLYNSLDGVVSCSWPTFRGVMTPACAWANGFGGMTQSGRAAFESRALGITSFSRASALTFNGSSGGVFPFTSVAATSDPWNSLNSVNTENQIPTHIIGASIRSSTVVGNLTTELQGLSANVSCNWQAIGTSPITQIAIPVTGDLFATNTTVACNPVFSIDQYAPLNRIVAATCPEAAGTTKLYVKQYADYTHGGTTQDLECTISPYLTTNTILFSFASNTSSIIASSPLKIAPSSAMTSYLDSHVGNIPFAINNVGQSRTNNIVAEAIIALVSGYHGEDNTKQAGIWEDYLRGMIEYDGTHSRHFWEQQARDSTSFPQSGFRTVESTFQYRAYGWHSTWTVYVLLIPVFFITVLTLGTFLFTSLLPNALPDFDPTDTGSLMFRAAQGTLHKIADTTKDEDTFRETEVRFDDDFGGLAVKH